MKLHRAVFVLVLLAALALASLGIAAGNSEIQPQKPVIKTWTEIKGLFK